jgi:uncharacterized protein YjeT (DUF2065 family)
MSPRGAYIIVSAAISVVVAYNWGCYLQLSDDALNGIIGLFSILAGVLVAVISIVGDPSMLLPGNWRVGFEHAKDIQDKIARFSYLFSLYIFIVFLVIISQIVKVVNIEQKDIIFNILTFVSMFGFLLSLPLPFSLMSIQKERMNEEIKRRKKE